MKTAISALAALFLFTASPVGAAELNVFVSGAMAHAFEDIGNAFAKAHGHTINFTVGTTRTLQDKLRAGEAADLVEVTAPGMDALVAENLVIPATRIDVARGLIGVAVRDGATRPDISTPEAFKAALLAARSVSHVDPAQGGQSGTYLAGLMKRLGIAEEMAKKTLPGKTGADAVQNVASGEADIGISFVSEIMPVKGVTLVGTLPEAIQNYTSYAAAIPANAANPDVARALLAAITGEEGARVIRDAGLEPLGTH